MNARQLVIGAGACLLMIVTSPLALSGALVPQVKPSDVIDGMAQCLGLGGSDDKATSQGELTLTPIPGVSGSKDGLLIKLLGHDRDIAYLKHQGTDPNSHVATYIFTGSINDDTVECGTAAACVDARAAELTEWMSDTVKLAAAGELASIVVPPFDPEPVCTP